MLAFSLYETPPMPLNATMMNKSANCTPVTDAIAAPSTGSARPHDALILSIARTKDKAAFVELFQYFAPRVKSYLLRGGMGDGLAEELAQETMLAVWNKAEGFNPARASASTWIFTIARNKKIDHMRKGVRYDVDIDALENETQSNEPSAAQGMIHQQETTRIAEAIQKLPAEQADLIRESFFEGKSHADIAAEKKIPLGTVKSRLRLALERLRGDSKVKELWS
jgi:RNA polymerase sigma factor (sigma-70 family)